MSASVANDHRAAVGRRIGQARREQGLTQGELAARIGVSLTMLDRYETGKADVSGYLRRIAEVTGRPVSWFTSSAQYEGRSEGGKAEFHAEELGQRIAESRGRRGLTRRELAEAVGVSLGKIERYESGAESPAGVVERIATVLDEPSSWLETGELSAQADDLGDSYRRLWEERSELARRLDELQVELAEERRKHGEAAAKGARLEGELECVKSDQLALTEMLEQSRSDPADSRTQLDQLAQRVAQLEAELRAAEHRAAEAAARLERAETELEHREQERSLAEELDLRQPELSIRSPELDTRETAVAGAAGSVDARRRALGDVELRAAAVERCEEALRLREGELEHRAGVLAELARRLDKLRDTAGVEGRRTARQDEHLLIASNRGYRFVARQGAAPDPGEIVELDDGRYRCLRTGASPFPGDDRPCAVLEPVASASEP